MLEAPEQLPLGLDDNFEKGEKLFTLVPTQERGNEVQTPILIANKESWVDF